MQDVLTQILTIVPPPAQPEGASGDWAAAERELGTPLPADYKAFIGAYGSGQLCNFFRVRSPFSRIYKLVGSAQLNERGGAMTCYKLRAADGRWVPATWFPKPGGALCWCDSDNGDQICWNTSSNPVDWEVVINQEGDDWLDIMPGMSTTRFVLDVITGALPQFAGVLPTFSPAGPSFQPGQQPTDD